MIPINKGRIDIFSIINNSLQIDLKPEKILELNIIEEFSNIFLNGILPNTYDLQIEYTLWCLNQDNDNISLLINKKDLQKTSEWIIEFSKFINDIDMINNINSIQTTIMKKVFTSKELLDNNVFLNISTEYIIKYEKDLKKENNIWITEGHKDFDDYIITKIEPGNIEALDNFKYNSEFLSYAIDFKENNEKINEYYRLVSKIESDMTLNWAKEILNLLEL